MAVKHNVTVSVEPTNGRLSSAQRRAAQIAALSTRQAELKQEAAERRAQRADQKAPGTSTSRRAAPA
jgi:hypothetical protein